MKLDGLREDTYAYSDLEGLSRWAKELKQEYPHLFLVGEIMDFDRTRLSYYFNHGQKNYLSSVADFGFSSEIYQLIAEEKPVSDFYRAMANDFIYREPNMMLTFMDNHDMGRFYSAVYGNVQKYFNAFTLLFGMRGIPQLYYGDEIGMLGGYDPVNRNQFPGGFGHPLHNAFIRAGREDNENRIFNQMKAFTQARKDYPDIFDAPMIHDLQNDIYLVSRKDPNSFNTLLIAYNSGEKTQDADFTDIVTGYFNDYEMVKAPIYGKLKIDLSKNTLILPGNESMMIVLKKSISR